MRRKGKCFSFHTYKKNKKAFALAEIVLAMAFIGMLTLLVGSLGTQVMSFVRSTKQTSAVLEMRNKMNSMTKNPAEWLDKMRSSIVTNGFYAGCLPDKAAATSTYDCHATMTDDELNALDPELKSIAGGLHVMSAPIVDKMGEKIAGTIEEPFYLNSEGRPCLTANAAASCPMKSTGYFMRSNPGTGASDNPGDVKFVVKIERNLASVAVTGHSPMKAQYMNMDIGGEWQDSAACPGGSVKVGYLNGAPFCANIDTTRSCTGAGELNFGVDIHGNLICKTFSPCTSGSPILDSSTGTLSCVAETPCKTANTVFIGYLPGNGGPICQSTDTSDQCHDGQAQVGQTVVSGVSHATCANLPTCLATQKISFDGSHFVCEANLVAETSSSSSLASSASSSSTSTVSLAGKRCDPGKQMVGIADNGDLICEGIVASPSAQGAVVKFLNADMPIAMNFLPIAGTGIHLDANKKYLVDALIKTDRGTNPSNTARGDYGLFYQTDTYGLDGWRPEYQQADIVFEASLGINGTPHSWLAYVGRMFTVPINLPPPPTSNIDTSTPPMTVRGHGYMSVTLAGTISLLASCSQACSSVITVRQGSYLSISELK